MTVSSAVRKAGPYTGNGSQTVYPFSFKIYTKNDIEVITADTNGLETTLVVDSTYSVTINADQDNNPGGYITLLVAALTLNYSLVILGNLPDQQLTDLTNLGGFFPQTVEDMDDRNTILIQQLAEKVDRSVQVPATSTLDPADLVDTIVAAGTAATTFFGVYYGAYPANPSTDPFGNPPNSGDMYYNTVTHLLMVYDAALVTWTTQPSGASMTSNVFTGTGAQVNFTLSTTPYTINNLLVYVGGVAQRPTTDYTVVGTTLTFAVAPPNAANNVLAFVLNSILVGSIDGANIFNTVTYTKIKIDQTPAELLAGVTPTVTYLDPGDIRRYGASTAAANNAAAIQAAISQAQQVGGAPLRIPYGTYDVQSALTISSNYVSIVGDDIIRSVIRKVGNFDLLTISGGAHALLDRVNLASSGGADVSRGLVINTTGHVSMPNLRVSSHGSHGIEVLQANQLNFGDVVSASNLGDGLKMTGSGGIQANACTFVNFNSSGNTGMGARFITAKNNFGFIACQGNIAGGFEFSTCFGNVLTIYAESNTGPDLTFTATCVAPNFGGNYITVAFAEDAPTFAGGSAATNCVLVLKPGPTFQAIHNTLRADQFVLTNQKTDGTAPTGVLTFSHTANGVFTMLASALASAQAIVLSNSDPGGIDFITDRVRSQWVLMSAAAPSGGAGQTILGATHATTVGAAGGATALPATPLGYLIANVDGTQVKIPYYNN